MRVETFSSNDVSKQQFHRVYKFPPFQGKWDSMSSRLARSGRPNGTRHSCVLLGRDLVVSPCMGASQLSPTESEDRRHQRPGVMMAHRPYGSTGHTARLGRAKKLVDAGLEPNIISHRGNPREPTPNWDRTPMEGRQDHGYLTRPPATYSSDFEKDLPKSMPPIGGLMASPVSSQHSDPGRLQLHVAVRLGCWYGLGVLHQDGLGRTQVITTPACTQHVTVAYTWPATPPEGVQAAAITHPPVAQLIYCIAAWGRL
ncbi:hypothetical protein PGTUg99_021744 [Puccinia graminis f. sp. tritici]|uniref:Uncharacterized protein n=1 Tax=Puccinia graminis f. sp. tritici TaxID=56615 RepID=A0A5B0S7A0_PUCGR|nr:hypothetical protein PGTUg99_021744 [Puccinia graminis f. sp. tritici]